MKKSIIIGLSLLLIVAVYLISSNPIDETVRPKTLDWQTGFFHPKADSVDLHISLDYNDTIQFKGKSLDGRKALVYLGNVLAEKPTSARGATCVSCHQLKGSGTGFTNKAIGGGDFQKTYNNFYEWACGEKSLIDVDAKPFKNMSILNAYRLDRQGGILNANIQGEFPLEMQIDTALNVAHFMDDLVRSCKDNQFIQEMSLAIFDRKFDIRVAKASISAWEQTLTTSENNINKHIRQPNDYEIENQKGFLLYLSRDCNGCHATGKLAASRDKFALLDSVKTPRLDLNNSDHKGYFQSATETSFYQAIKRCDQFATAERLATGKQGRVMTWREIFAVRSFIRNNLTDDRFRS